MQIDFHHGTTYVVARLAGFSQAEADIVAYSAQYVDDAISRGTVHFDNKAMYSRINSAHKMIDKRNAKELANHLVWIPFHFLPGNGGEKAGENPRGEFIEKIVCVHNSHIARDMVRNTIEEKGKMYGLHRLGVAMHVFADTYAHEGFAGVLHPVNEVENANEISDSRVFGSCLKTLLLEVMDDTIPPLGHGRANVLPDMPFLEWEYKNHKNETVRRNNTDLFCDAADEMCKAMKRYRFGDPDAQVDGIALGDMEKIRKLFLRHPDKDGNKRHVIWLHAIRDGYFSFGGEDVAYTAKGKSSWKEQAIGSSFDLRVHSYNENFLTSNWKLFHDALQAHRFHVIHDLLPRYSICAA